MDHRSLIITQNTRTSLELGSFCQSGLDAIGVKSKRFCYRTTRLRNTPLRALEEKRLERRVLELIRTYAPSFVLVIKGDQIPPKTLEAIRSIAPSAALVNYWIDDPIYFHVSKNLSPHYDVFLTNAPSCVARHREAGAAHPDFLTFGADPHLHRKISMSPEEVDFWGSDVAFTGSLTTDRLTMLEQLDPRGLKIWCKPEVSYLGDNYQISKSPVPANSPVYSSFTNRPVWGEDMVKVCNASRIVLNLHVQNAPTMRDFEVPACGAFLLTDHVEGLGEALEIGKEIGCFNSPAEGREKICHYLKHPGERQSIADTGYRRVLKDHLYKNRMEELVGLLEEFRNG